MKLLAFISLLLLLSYPVEAVAIISEKTSFSIETPAPKAIVFLAGFDQGDNTYYQQAKNYFQSQDYQVVDSLYSLQEILIWLNHNSQDVVRYEEIHIVSHSNPWRGMSMKVVPGGGRITEQSLEKAIAESVLPSLKNVLSEDAKLIFHACGLGTNEGLLAQLKKVFTQKCAPTLYASPMYSVFGDRFSPHYMAKAYYAYYPTAYFPGNWSLEQDLKKSYPNASFNWSKVLKTKTPMQPGEAYTYQYNVPINWTFTFEDKSRVPTLENADDIMDWIVEQEELSAALFALNIPIEKYRWRTQRKGNSLTIMGKTTVVCVLQPLMEAEDEHEYLEPNISDSGIFITL